MFSLEASIRVASDLLQNKTRFCSFGILLEYKITLIPDTRLDWLNTQKAIYPSENRTWTGNLAKENSNQDYQAPLPRMIISKHLKSFKLYVHQLS